MKTILPSINNSVTRPVISINSANNSLKVSNMSIISFKGDSFEKNNEARDRFYQSICAYQSDKEEFYDLYLQPLLKTNNSAGVNASILLCGADKSILNNFGNAIGAVANYCRLNVTDMSADASSDSFMQKLASQLETNREYCNCTGRRSVIMLDSPERFLGMNIADAKSRTSFNFDEADMNILNTNKNAETIAKFKTLLDTCHHLPDDASSGYATTFIFNSTNPHLIHPDFRDGKMSKVYIDLVRDENLTQLLNEQLDAQDIDIDKFRNYTEKVKNMEIPENSLPSYLLNIFTSPNQFTGGYSYKLLNDVVRKARVKTVELPYPTQFVVVFADILSKTPRDISPQDIVKYNKIKNSISKQLDEYEKLNALDNDGMLNVEQQNELSKVIEYEKNIAQHLTSKQNNGLITPDEELLLQKLTKRYNGTIASVQKQTLAFTPKITSIPYNGKQLEYASGKKAELYHGDLGYNSHILWAQPSGKDTLNGVLNNLSLIKQQRQFEDIDRLQMSKFDGIEEFGGMQPIANYDADGRKIFQMWV